MKWIVSGMLFLFAAIIMINCEDPLGSGGPPDDDPDDIKKDTSIFIGKWAQVFDTSSQEKKDYWCNDMGCSDPITMEFINDSLYDTSGQIVGGSIRMYSYTIDTLILYLKSSFTVGNHTTYYLHDTSKQWYRMNDDTLNFNPNDSIYNPVLIRS